MPTELSGAQPQCHQRMKPSVDAIVYSCGAIPWPDGRWLVSYGVPDELCCLRLIIVPCTVRA